MTDSQGEEWEREPLIIKAPESGSWRKGPLPIQPDHLVQADQPPPETAERWQDWKRITDQQQEIIKAALDEVERLDSRLAAVRERAERAEQELRRRDKAFTAWMGKASDNVTAAESRIRDLEALVKGAERFVKVALEEYDLSIHKNACRDWLTRARALLSGEEQTR